MYYNNLFCTYKNYFPWIRYQGQLKRPWWLFDCYEHISTGIMLFGFTSYIMTQKYTHILTYMIFANLSWTCQTFLIKHLSKISHGIACMSQRSLIHFIQQDWSNFPRHARVRTLNKRVEYYQFLNVLLH